MNRFHLLVNEQEEDGGYETMITKPAPVESVVTSKNVKKVEPAKASPVKKEVASPAKASSRTSGPNDRRSRGPRRDEGQKHQTVGKGSWGRPIEEVKTAEEPVSPVEAEGETTEVAEAKEEKVEKKVQYKTVQEYLKEQEEQRRKLQATRATRHANEGIEVDTERVVLEKKASRKEQPAVIKTEEKKLSLDMGRLTLQELAQLTGTKYQDEKKQQARSSDAPRGGRQQDRVRRDNIPAQKQPIVGKSKVDLQDIRAFPAL